MKKLLSFIVGLAAFSAAHAQDTLHTTPGYAESRMNGPFIWSIGVEPSLPVGNFSNYSGFGLGGSLQGEFKPGNMVGITLNAGFIDYFGKTVQGIKYPDFKYIPVLAGVKVYLGNVFFIHGQLGPGFGTSGLGTSFWYGGGLGVTVTRAVDVEVKYTGWKQNEESTSSGGGYSGPPATGPIYGGHYSVIGLRLAYAF